MSFDPNKPVQTRSGNKARIICTDSRNKKFPIVALITAGGEEIVASFSSNGSYTSGGCDSWDLVNIPEERVRFVNIYKSRAYFGTHDTKEDAYSKRLEGWLGCLKLTIVEDEITKVEKA